MNGRVLFVWGGAGGIGARVHQVEQKLVDYVESYSKHEFDAQSDQEVVEALVRKLSITPIILNEDCASESLEETIVAVKNDGAVVHRPALRVTRTFTFSGDKSLWDYGMGAWPEPTLRGEINGCSITIGVEVPSNAIDVATRDLSVTIEQLQNQLALQKKVFDAFNIYLGHILSMLIQARRKRQHLSAVSIFHKGLHANT